MFRGKRASNRYAIFILVAFGHVVLVVFLSRLDVATVARRELDAVSLVLLDLRAPTNTSAAAPAIAVPSKAPTQRNKKIPALEMRDNAVGDGAAPSAAVSEALLSEPPIDWDGEGEQVAKSQAALIFKQLKRDCDESALRGEQRPKCRKYKKPDAWKPEPKKFGIDGGLPYVRLGKRCVLGLGFFGCAVGKLPEADGHVFDDMREPDRPRSSVPDPNEQ
jgi:hypothetical protein